MSPQIPPGSLLMVSGCLLALLLYLEKKGEGPLRLLTKTALSSLFLAAAIVEARGPDAYFMALSLGLLLCLAGDVFLALPGERPFKVGLVAFLLGHVAYVVAFVPIAEWRLFPVVALPLLILLSTSVFLWLRPRLGPMKAPVAVYIGVITAMVAASLFLGANGRLSLVGRFMVAGGALLFYFSDIFVARDRFVRPGFLNRLLGLPIYYSAQFLLAFSVRQIP